MNPLKNLPDLGNSFNKFKTKNMTIAGRFVKAMEGTTNATTNIINLCDELMKIADGSNQRPELYQLAGKILSETKKLTEVFEDKEEKEAVL